MVPGRTDRPPTLLYLYRLFPRRTVANEQTAEGRWQAHANQQINSKHSPTQNTLTICARDHKKHTSVGTAVEPDRQQARGRARRTEHPIRYTDQIDVGKPKAKKNWDKGISSFSGALRGRPHNTSFNRHRRITPERFLRSFPR